MKFLFGLLVALLTVSPLVAAEGAPQSEETAAVLEVAQQFLDSLQARDGDRMNAACLPGVQAISGRAAASGFTVRQRTVDADAARLKDGKESLLERMWSPTVHINGRIAVVWTRYDFHVNGKFTHNGTDCFTLLKTDAGWKIASCVYSVEPGDRTENPAGPPK